jgi:hypothetical protein
VSANQLRMSLMLITSLMAQTEMACSWRQSAGRSLAARGCMRQVPSVELLPIPRLCWARCPLIVRFRQISQTGERPERLGQHLAQRLERACPRTV